MLASLDVRGHEVVWWTSTFDHLRKVHHFKGDTTARITPKLSLRLLAGCGYSRNISFRRILDHRQVARKFALAAAECSEPDVIVAAFPTIELCCAATEYGNRRGIPVIVDMRDMWPDIFADAMPTVIRPFSSLLLSSFHRQTQRACASAIAITGMTEAFVDWGICRAGRKRGCLDRAFPFAYEREEIPVGELADAERYWDELGVNKKQAALTVCYFGAMGLQLDLTPIIEAARILSAGSPVRFVLCGCGQRLDEYRRQAHGLANVFLPGWVNRAQVWSLMRRSNVGVDPLPDRHDFLSTINNKAVEYLSAGLPVISSPQKGVLHDFLSSQGCGMSYSAGVTGEFVDILRRLLMDTSSLREMSARALSVFENQFSADIVYPRMAAHLSEVIASRRAQIADSSNMVATLRQQSTTSLQDGRLRLSSDSWVAVQAISESDTSGRVPNKIVGRLPRRVRTIPNHRKHELNRSIDWAHRQITEAYGLRAKWFQTMKR